MYLSSGKLRAKASHPACFCFPPTQPVPPALAALRDGWADACPGIAVPGLEWQCHQLWCSWAGLGAQAPVLSQMYLPPPSCASRVLRLSQRGETHNNNTKAGGLQQGMGSWEFLQQYVPGMVMSVKAADQKC